MGSRRGLITHASTRGIAGQDLLADLHPDQLGLSEAMFVEALADMGLTLRKCTQWHWQIREDGVLLAQWWPTTGACSFIRDPTYRPTTDDLFVDNPRAPLSGHCTTMASLLAWLRSI